MSWTPFRLTDLVISGDINCSGEKAGTVDHRLFEILACNFTQHVIAPTRLDNLLDLVICWSDVKLINMKLVKDVAFSDHRLVLFDIKLPRPCVSVMTLTYRKLICACFESNLYSSKAFSDSSELVDDYIAQLNEDVVRTLNSHAPIKS